MQPITFDHISYRIGDQPMYLISGEFHYFRVPKTDWHARMRLFKQAGGNCLATYIPWLLHEPQEGAFCFGETADYLDLEGFLQVALEEELYVIARPGPYQYSELNYDGLPGWLCENYPELLARNFRGEIFRKSSVSYIHPLFLEKVQRWFEVVVPIIARHTVSRSGAVAMVQFDNELVGIHEWFGTLDYHPVSMGLGRADGRYPRFLKERYGQIAALNRAYGTDYAGFSVVQPPDPDRGQSSEEVRARKDYFTFYLGTIAEYACILVDLLRKHGIDTPFIHNSGTANMNAHFVETVAALGEGFLLGSDHYYNLDQNWPQNNPTPQYAARCFYSLEMLRLMGFPPSVFEIPGGSCSDWPPVTESDARAAYLTNLALGMKGHNYYIFTGGPNPPKAGKTTDLYDYTASIGAHGEIRPLYQAQKDFGDLVKEYPWLAETSRAYDFRLGFDFEMPRSEYYWKGGDFLCTQPRAWDFWRKGVLTSAFCASLSPALVNLAEAGWAKDVSTPLLVVCASSMARRMQENLVRFLQNGGRALFLPVLPTLDEYFQPCTLLLDFLGAPVQAASRNDFARPTLAGVVNVNGTPFTYNNLPQGAQVLGVDENNGDVLAWKVSILGGGSALVAGLTWVHAMREHERLLSALLVEQGLQRIIACSNPNVWASLLVKDNHAMLFLLNLFTSPQAVEVCLTLPDGSDRNLADIIPSMTVRTFALE
jgi:beta-galactosidase